MATITAQMVKELRQKTDLPMMECKQALGECDCDMAAAIDWLRKKHKGKLTERSDRMTGEGRIGVFISPDGKIGGIIELQCETAPVGKNEMFVELANAFAAKVASGSEASPDPETVRKDPELDTKFTEVYGKLRETMNLTKCRRVEGEHLSSYVHHDGKSGVLLSLDAKPNSEKNIGGDLCMHALFTKPLSIGRDGIPADQVETVRKQALEMAATEGKPEQIAEKIAEGRVNSFYGEKVLMEQLHVKTDEYGKAKVCDILKEASVNEITDLVVMQVGA